MSRGPGVSNQSSFDTQPPAPRDATVRHMLHLPPVTLVAIDTAYHALTRAALADCLRAVEFGKVAVWSEDLDTVPTEAWVNHGWSFYQISKDECRTTDDWSHLLWYRVPEKVTTTHALIIQYDSWIINPAQWSDDWLQYDYIGAPWWYADGSPNVGNGGFSLRSKRLMDHLAKYRTAYPLVHPEDDALCRRYGPALAWEGFRFAPPEVAARFSFERSYPRDWVPFGFHGQFNWPLVLSPAQIEARLALAPPKLQDHVHHAQMREVQAGMHVHP